MEWIFVLVFLASGLYVIWKIKQGEQVPRLYFVPIAASVLFSLFVIANSDGIHADTLFLVASAFVCAASWPVAKLWYGPFGRDIRRIKDDIQGRR